MRFFTKLFLGIMLILTLSLGLAEYYTVFSTFQTSLEHETDSAMRKHQLVKYALQADLVAAGQVDSQIISTIVDRTRQGFHMDFNLNIVTDSDELDYLYYSIHENQGAPYILVTSCFMMEEQILRLESREEISYVFAESRQLQKNCRIAFAETLIIGLFLAALLSIGLIHPIRKLSRASRAFAQGDYDVRVKPTSHDEVGELAVSFNRMADSINDKIQALELAVVQREDFVASFAHEIKTPMTSIIGYADTLYQREMPTAQVQEAAGYILNEGLRLEALSFKLLELVTLGRQDFVLESMNMVECLEDIRQTSLIAAQKRGLTLQFSVEEGYGRVEYDLFKTMILNLIDNGMKSGGDRVKVMGVNKGTHYDIVVADNGRGIPDKEMHRITEAFYMVDKSRSRREHGAGLGLALCEKIAEIHGTHLHFRSKEGTGTRVRIALTAGEGGERE